MKTFRWFILILCGAALGVVLGTALQRRRIIAAAETMTNVVEPSVQRAPEKSSHGLPLYSSALVNELAENLSAATGPTRWLYWADAIERASVTDFPQLVQLAGGKRPLLHLIAGRWAEIDPKNFFETMIKSDPLDGSIETLEMDLVREWSRRDPAGLIQAVKEAPPLGNLDRLKSTVARNVIRSDPELGLRIISEWNLGTFGASTSGVAKWVEADPRHAAEFVLKTPAGFASHEVIVAVGEEWGRIDPSAAMAFASQHPDALSKKLGEAALGRWAAKNQEEATQWLEQSDADTRNRFAAAVVQEWAKQDPASALIWSEANLSGSSLTMAAGGVLRGAAEKDVSEAARLVEVMQPSGARAEGAVSVANTWFSKRFHGEVPPGNEDIQWLEHLDRDSINRVLQHINLTWAETEPKTLADFISRVPSEQVPSDAYVEVGRALARTDPMGALKWAETLPLEAGLKGGSASFSEWANSQPGPAGEWFNQLPANDQRRPEFLKWTLLHLAFEQNAPEKLAALTIQDSAAVRGAIDKLGLTEEKRMRLFSVLQNAEPAHHEN